jgi:hypothetical protein
VCGLCTSALFLSPSFSFSFAHTHIHTYAHHCEWRYSALLSTVCLLLLHTVSPHSLLTTHTHTRSHCDAQCFCQQIHNADSLLSFTIAYILNTHCTPPSHTLSTTITVTIAVSVVGPSQCPSITHFYTAPLHHTQSLIQKHTVPVYPTLKRDSPHPRLFL